MSNMPALYDIAKGAKNLQQIPTDATLLPRFGPLPNALVFKQDAAITGQKMSFSWIMSPLTHGPQWLCKAALLKSRKWNTNLNCHNMGPSKKKKKNLNKIGKQQTSQQFVVTQICFHSSNSSHTHVAPGSRHSTWNHQSAQWFGRLHLKCSALFSIKSPHSLLAFPHVSTLGYFV